MQKPGKTIVITMALLERRLRGLVVTTGRAHL
jgi:hypothetical protein